MDIIKKCELYIPDIAIRKDLINRYLDVIKLYLLNIKKI